MLGVETGGGATETVEFDATQRIENDLIWKGRNYRIRGDLVLVSGTLTIEDAQLEMLCDYARQYRIRWEGGSLRTKNATIGGVKKDGITRPTVFELYNGSWRAETTTVQYSCGILFSYATRGILDATKLLAGENPDSVIVCGKAKVVLRDSVFDLALHLPGYGGTSATLDLPIKEPQTRIIDRAYVPGVDYRLELQNVTIPNVWFLFFVSVGNTGQETVYTLNRCPNIVPGLTAINLKGEAHLPSSWSGPEWPGKWAPMPKGIEIAVGTLRVRTATDSTCLAGWGVYLDGKETDVAISGSTTLCELMITGGACSVLGTEGTHDIWVTCTTTDAQEGARLLLRNVNLAYPEPSPHYKQIRSSADSTVELENVCFGDHLMLIADGGEIRVGPWRGNRAGVTERVNGGRILWRESK